MSLWMWGRRVTFRLQRIKTQRNDSRWIPRVRGNDTGKPVFCASRVSVPRGETTKTRLDHALFEFAQGEVVSREAQDVIYHWVTPSPRRSLTR